jgi:hypothetical protein
MPPPSLQITEDHTSSGKERDSSTGLRAAPDSVEAPTRKLFNVEPNASLEGTWLEHLNPIWELYLRST